MEPITTEEAKAPAITSTPSHLKMIRWQPETYAGITSDQKLVVFFPEEEGTEKPLMELRGDQGVGKTSALACLKALLGGGDAANAINSIENDKKAEIEFEYDGDRFIARLTKSGFSLTEIQEVAPGAKPIKKAVGSPVSVIQRFVGPVGTDPNMLKAMKGPEQISWLRGIMSVGDEGAKLERQLTEKYNKAYTDRTAINNQLKFAKQSLVKTTYYEWDGKNKTIITTDDFDNATKLFSQDDSERTAALDKEYADAKQKLKEYDLGKGKLANYEIAKTENLKKIARLNEELLQLQERIKGIEKNNAEIDTYIETGNQYIKERENAEAELTEVEAKVRKEGDFKLARKEFIDAKDYYKNYETLLNASESLSAQLKEYETLKQRLIAQITPDIEGLEVCVPKNIDVAYERDAYMIENPEATDEEIEKHVMALKPETREGIYYKNHSIAMLSESELWDLWLQLCRIQKVKVVCVENITSLGSDAVGRINQLAASGCYVFFSAMERGKTKLQVTFLDKAQ